MRIHFTASLMTAFATVSLATAKGSLTLRQALALHLATIRNQQHPPAMRSGGAVLQARLVRHEK